MLVTAPGKFLELGIRRLRRFEWSHYSRSATARQEFSPHPGGAFLSPRSVHGILTVSVCGQQNQDPTAAPDG